MQSTEFNTIHPEQSRPMDSTIQSIVPVDDNVMKLLITTFQSTLEMSRRLENLEDNWKRTIGDVNARTEWMSFIYLIRKD